MFHTFNWFPKKKKGEKENENKPVSINYGKKSGGGCKTD